MADTRASNQQDTYQPPSNWERFRHQHKPDYDGDGTPDHLQDKDGDGVNDYEERWEHDTDPNSADTDGDGVKDGAEIAGGSDPTVPDGPGDTDGDGVPDRTEIADGTDPANADTDGDGLTDGYEFRTGTDGTKADSDRDGTPDGLEDQDGDGLTAIQEQQQGTRPDKVDSDGDGNADSGQPMSEFLDRVNDAAAQREAELAEATSGDADPTNPTDARPAEAADDEPDFLDYLGDKYDRFERWYNDKDGDGLTRLEEEGKHGIGTSDSNVDTDGDDIPDKWEAEHPLADPLTPDAHTDPDGDGKTILDEYKESPDQPPAVKVQLGDSFLGYELVGDGDTPYYAVGSGPIGAAVGTIEIFDSRDPSGEPIDPADLPPGSKVRWDNQKWGHRKELSPKERDSGGLEPTPSRMDRDEPYPGGEREPEPEDFDPWAGEDDDGSIIGKHRGEPATSSPVGADPLGPTSPQPEEADTSPIGKAVDPDEVAAEVGGRTATDGQSGTGASSGGDESTSGMDGQTLGGDGNSAPIESRNDDWDWGQSGDTSGGDSGGTSSGADASEGNESETDDRQASGSGGSGSEDDSGDWIEGTVTGVDEEMTVSDEASSASGDPEVYTQDEHGNWIDSNGNKVDASTVPGEGEGDSGDGSSSGQGSEGGDTSSDGVSTSVDPDGGGMVSRIDAEKALEDVGAPQNGAQPQPIDPNPWQENVEQGTIVGEIITSDDLAQPVGDEGSALDDIRVAPTEDPNASGGRFGTGVIDPHPDDDTEIQTDGPWQDTPDVSDVDAQQETESTEDAPLEAVELGTAIVAAPVPADPLAPGQHHALGDEFGTGAANGGSRSDSGDGDASDPSHSGDGDASDPSDQPLVKAVGIRAWNEPDEIDPIKAAALGIPDDPEPIDVGNAPVKSAIDELDVDGPDVDAMDIFG